LFKQVETREKVRYLRDNKETIDKLIFDLQHLELHSSKSQSYYPQIESYASALDFVKVIASNESFQIQLEKFNNLSNAGRSYRELPHGMTDVVLAYVHDLKILASSES
jgi:hypothetical protein